MSGEKYGVLSLKERLSLVACILELPFTVTARIITSIGAAHNKSKSTRRVLGDATFKFLGDRLNYHQIQFVFGTSVNVYESWAKSNKLPIVVDDLGDTGGQLFWIGSKQLDRVVLYMHGGGFVAPLQDYMLDFWRSVQKTVEAQKVEVGFAVLAYSIIPDAGFPQQLRQAVEAVHHLVRAGVPMQNIQIVGDSAGANLVMQLYSHILHPHPDVPPLSVTTKFSSMCLISPWISMLGEGASSFESAKSVNDVMNPKTSRAWGARVLQDVPDAYRPYVDAVNAPSGWFKGMDGIVDRILVIVGDAECPYNSTVVFEEDHLSKHHPSVTLFTQGDGVHDDPFMEFFARSSKHGEAAKLICEWVASG
ncbi:hypothetical protein E1B28_001716 [Marasmius oreades]|uniref:Alpha/beta hydrolase fold-3 domain-containing protein n=1 Tax=Marasmius oreades TaxID=181124 RepID=A0A9P7V460_9AGAR|nr:uncharacterized protein E1B28_001716 [Marasmius oreades]KAG7099919.1 hypothetical protein E1B28_001716 [Marasmius oreades]